ncbi:hypothetical protein MTR67_012758 [Solanum verrucosum]|uniref:Uncharacterized protein n=1 Tax=Solanum verrucosum TaxID=315347 RepID=A0AAF0TL09_SOLVR|nr:hypothetical protein MTR67_012758 [Solanum verrucosum]
MSISDNGVTVQNRSESSLVAEVKEKQDSGLILLQLKGAIHQERVEVLSQGGDSVLRYQGRLCVPKKGLGTQINLSTISHPQTDDQAKRTIQTLKDMLRACVINLKGSWDDHLPLIEFAYNNSYHSSIQMGPYKVLYGRRCRSPVSWFEVGQVALIGPDSVHDDMEKVQLIRDRLKTAQSRQKSYVDVRRRDLEFQIDDWVFLNV